MDNVVCSMHVGHRKLRTQGALSEDCCCSSFVSVVSVNPDGRLAFSDLVHGVLSTWLKMTDMS